MKKFSASCFSILFLLFFVFLAAGCGGGGGVSAATGGNNAGKKGGAGGAGSAPTLRINPNDSPTLTGINWQTIDFTVKIGNRAPIKRTLNLGEIMDLNLSDADGLAVGETIDIEAKIVNAAGLEFEAFSGVKTITAGTNNVVMTVGRKVQIQIPANVTLEGGVTYVVVTKNGAILPKATTTATQYFRYWQRDDNTPAGVICNVSEPLGWSCFISISEATCKLNDNYFPYITGGYNYSSTSSSDSRSGLDFKNQMITEFGSLYTNSPAYKYLATLPNLSEGTHVDWYIPSIYEVTRHFVTTKNSTLNAIGAVEFDSNAEYMTCNMKMPNAGDSYWSLAYYAKANLDYDTILTYREDYTTYSKRLRAIGYIRIH